MTTVEAQSQKGRSGVQRVVRVAVLTVVGIVVVCGAGAAVSWWQLQDLRDLPSLRQTNAQVLGQDYRRRLPDLVEMRYRVEGERVEASIPGDAGYESGDTARVAYVPDDRDRVRLVDGWEPAYTTWLEYGAIGLAAVALAGLKRVFRSGFRQKN